MERFIPGLDIYLMLLLVAALINSRYTARGINEGCLSLENCNNLKGLLAILVMFHHLSQDTYGGEIFQCFHHMGYLFVAEFFFLSGYGLMLQYVSKKDYLQGYLLKRLSAICIPYVCCILLYWVVSPAYRGTIYTVPEVIALFMKGRPIALNSWYVIASIWLYILFYTAAKLMKKNYWGIICIATVFCVAWIFGCRALQYGMHWYMSPFAFVLGMIWALREQIWLPMIKRHYWRGLLVISTLFLPTFLLTYHGKNPLLFAILSSSLFVILVLLILCKVKLRSGVIAWLGKISFEIYMLHGLFMVLFRGTYFYVNNETLWVGVVIICAVVAAYVMHKLFGVMIQAFRRAWTRDMDGSA